VLNFPERGCFKTLVFEETGFACPASLKCRMFRKFGGKTLRGFETGSNNTFSKRTGFEKFQF
jgi:hypothetical protein